MRFRLTLLAAAWAASPGDGRSAPIATNEARCEAASAYVAAILGKVDSRPRVFSSEQDPLADLPDSSRWINARTGKPGAMPPRSLLVRLKNDPAQSAVAACSSVRDVLNRHRVAFGKEAVEAAEQLSSGSFLYKADIHSVSMPAISSKGDEAVLVASGVAGPTGGGGFLEYLRRLPTGRWVLVSTAGLWVS